MTNTTLGLILLNPSDRPRAVAQTASSTPDSTSTIHAMTTLPSTVLSLAGYGALVRVSYRRPSRYRKLMPWSERSGRRVQGNAG
jgi:hypothetical protein